MQFIFIFHYLADKTEARPSNKLMPSVYTITDSSCTGTNQLERIGPLLTNEDGDFGAVSVRERICAAPILKVNRHLSDKFLGHSSGGSRPSDKGLGGGGRSSRPWEDKGGPVSWTKNKRGGVWPPGPLPWIRHCTLSRSVNRYIHTLYLVAFTACPHEKLPSKV